MQSNHETERFIWIWIKTNSVSYNFLQQIPKYNNVSTFGQLYWYCKGTCVLLNMKFPVTRDEMYKNIYFTNNNKNVPEYNILHQKQVLLY